MRTRIIRVRCARCQLRISGLVYKWIKNNQSNLLPTECLLCGSQGQGSRNLCDGCSARLPWMERSCPRCAAAVPGALLCSDCQRQPPSFDSTHALFWYQPPVSDLILRLKFQGVLSVASTFGLLLSDRLSSCINAYPQVLLPVPLHGSRLRARGYNQALEIARIVSRQLAIPLRITGIERTRPTTPQSALKSHADRRRNVHDAFRLRPGFVRQSAHIAILDDVMTSGATVQSLASALKQQGAGRVEVWICARAK